MIRIELGPQLGNTEIISLQEDASQLLETHEGQKILREIAAFDALAHLDEVEVGPDYTTDDYKTHPEKFSISDFYPAVCFVEDNIILASDAPFAHRTRLEKPIAEEMPELYARLLDPEVKVVLGDILKVKDANLRFFAVKGEPELYSEDTRDIIAEQLAKYGILVLFWSYDTEWEAEQLKRPEYARHAAYKERMAEAASRFHLFAEWGDILAEFGGEPEGPEIRYKWTIIPPSGVNHSKA